jgi:F0F1-type ATP synthase membrane subunit b/b'
MSETLQEITRVKQQMDALQATLHQLIREARHQGEPLRAIGAAAGYHHENIRHILTR